MRQGGLFRALRYAMGQPLLYGMDDRDYTVITPGEATWIARVGFALMLCVQWVFMGLWRKP